MLSSVLPALAKDMDTARGVDFLEQELNEVSAAIDGPVQKSDLLAKVPMKGGKNIWLALHVEVQGERGGDLPERMFFYNSMLRFKYLKKKETGRGIVDVVSLAILASRRPKGEAPFYERRSYDNELFYKYPAIRLWELDPETLKASGNPFDLVLLAGLLVLKSGRNDIRRVSYLKELGDLLDFRGWSREDKIVLYRFIEAILRPRSETRLKEYR